MTQAARTLIGSVVTDGRSAIDRDRRALNVPRLLRTQKCRQRRDVLGLAETAQAVLDGRLLAQFVGRLARSLGALRDQFLEALGFGRAGVDHVDVDAIALAELRKALGEVAHGGVDRRADGEISAW